MTGAFSCCSKVKSAPAVLADDRVLTATFAGTQGNLIEPAAMGESQHYSSQECSFAAGWGFGCRYLFR